MQITPVAQVVSHQNIHNAVAEAQRHGSIESVIVDTLGLMALTYRSKSPCPYRLTTQCFNATTTSSKYSDAARYLKANHMLMYLMKQWVESLGGF